ncbi:hypothetical protein VTO42DRAFT_531 [Malbranchea cinnamomea]
MNIPGYYYDPVKKKYFKVQPSHLVPVGSSYTRESIKERHRESRKRKREHAYDHRMRIQRVQRSMLHRHPLLGGLGLEREAGSLSLTSREASVKCAETCATLFERNTLVDFNDRHEGFGNISTFARDPCTGLLIVGFTTSGRSNLRSYTPSEPSERPSRYNYIGSDCRVAQDYEWVSTLSVSPAGYLLASCANREGQGEKLRLAKIHSPMETGLHFDRYSIEHQVKIPHSRCSASFPSNDAPQFALGADKTLLTFHRGESRWGFDLIKTPSDVFSVEWLSPTVVMGGLGNGAVMFFDQRSGGETIRFWHHPVVHCIRKIDDWRIVVNSGLHPSNSLCMYDLRFTPLRDRGTTLSRPYLRFPEYQSSLRGEMDACPQLGLLATASHMKTVQLFSLTTGQPVQPFDPRSFTSTSSFSPEAYSGRSSILSSSKQRDQGMRASIGENYDSPLPTLTSFTYSADISGICFQTVPLESGGDGSPSLLVGAGPVIDEWRL